jgi:hypothetical protein
MVPLDEPDVPPSWMVCQLPKAWMLLTLTAFDGMTELEPDEPPVLLAGAATTLTETSVTQTPPTPFHTFTWRVCEPLGAATGPFMYCAGQLDVLLLLSNE